VDGGGSTAMSLLNPIGFDRRVVVKRQSKQKLKARLERIFDRLYAAAEKVIREHDPCKVKINQHGASCLDCISRKGQGDASRLNKLCCAGCKFHTSKGCKANKPLTCRTWLCYTAQDDNPEAFRKLDRIAERAAAMGFYVGRGDKEDSINNALGYFGVRVKVKWFPKLTKG
jgi:hypothetical protein